MSTIVTRAGKGSPLTWNEVDNNFTNLNTDKYQSGSNVSLGTIAGTTITSSALTSGRVTYASTGGLLADSANLTFNGTSLGVGTASPTGTLEVVASSANNMIRLTRTTSAAGSGYIYANSTDLFGVNDGTLYPFIVKQGALSNSLVVDSSSNTIVSNGNLGLGVTPSAWGSGYKAIQSTNGASFGDMNGYTSIASNYYNNGSGDKYIANGYASRYLQSGTDGIHRWYNSASGTAGNAITFTQAMTLDASGQLGIGSTSPTTTVTIAASSNYPFIHWNNSSNSTIAFAGWHGGTGGDDDFRIGTSVAKAFTLRTNNTERMRIDVNGNLLVGTTSAGGVGLSLSGGGTQIISNYGSAYTVASFRVNGTQYGYITTSTGGTNFSTSSDYRLKENIAPMVGALDKVALLKPVTYTWKDGGADGQGFIAHELAEVVPDCVTGEKDATEEQEYEISPAIPAVLDEEGNEVTPAVEAVMGTRAVPVYQGIDTSFLVATLTAAIQEQQAMIDELKAKVAALEAA